MLEYAARSHVGYVRDNNQDDLYISGVSLTPEARNLPFRIDGMTEIPAIFSVCDGLGGEIDGDVASRLTVETLQRWSQALRYVDLGEMVDAVERFVQAAHTSIRQVSDLKNVRMGTTLALVIVRSESAYVFNTGDSRVYVLQNDRCFQWTHDHTAGGLQSHRLNRSIGIGDAWTPEAYQPIVSDFRLLICSDGLSDMVSAVEIEGVLNDFVRPSDAADRLLDLALSAGGHDNITLVVIDKRLPEPAFRQNAFIESEERKR